MTTDITTRSALQRANAKASMATTLTLSEVMNSKKPGPCTASPSDNGPDGAPLRETLTRAARSGFGSADSRPRRALGEFGGGSGRKHIRLETALTRDGTLSSADPAELAGGLWKRLGGAGEGSGGRRRGEWSEVIPRGIGGGGEEGGGVQAKSMAANR